MPKLDYGTSGGKGTSYSRLLTAHLCPRKFQLENIFNLGSKANKPDFAFGHAVAAGVQSLVDDPTNINRALVATMAGWDLPIYEELLKSKKSLWYAVRAVEKFYAMVKNPKTSILRKYEIAVFKDKTGNDIPAIEITFNIKCHDGYNYEGHIDLILKERGVDNYLILELKTTKFNNLSPAMFQNSSQALGYSVVLDSIVQEIGAKNSYYVMYLVYKSTQIEYETMLFPKNRVKRAHFINGLILDIEKLRMYKENNLYPQHGENCFNFFEDCAFLDTCGLSDETLQKMSPKHGEEGSTFAKLKHYDFEYDLDDIRAHQLQAIAEGTIASTHTPIQV